MIRLHRFLALVIVLAAGWTAAAVPVAAQDVPTVDYDVETLSFPELRDFDVPEPERFTLENGMTVFLLEDHELPLVRASARIATGSVFEPEDKVGLASVTGTVMRTGGTATMDPDSINQVLEGLGATVETSIGETSGSAYFSTLRENLDTVLPIYAEVLREPAFAEERVDLAKSQQQSSISRRNDNAQQIAFREFDKIVYGEDSPYARHAEYYTIDAIEREDLVDFHEQYYHPNNVILSVWGSFDTEEMKARLEEAFGDWQAAEDFAPPTPPAPEAERGSSVNFVQKDDVTQSTILMGHPGELQRSDEDYVPTVVMNEVLSGGFSGRLFQNVRSDQGLAYSVFGNYSAGYDRPGRFFAGVFTRSEATVEAARAVTHEIERMRSEAPTEEELQLAKDSYMNSFVFNFDTKQEILSRLMTYEHYDYPPDFLQQVRDGVEAVTADEVLRVAERYLYPDESHVLVVGRRQDFGEPLEALAEDGTVNEIDVSIPTSPPDETASGPVDAEAEASGREKLQAAREALGGAALDEIENMRFDSEGTVQSPQGEGTLQMSTTLTMDGKVHLEQQMPNGAVITIVDDGETMMLDTPQGTQQAPPQLRQQISGELWREVTYLMARLDDVELGVEDLGQEEVEGTTYETVRVTPPTGSAFTLYLDAETMRPARMDYQQQTQQGPQEATDIFNNYQEVSGVMVPFETVTYQNGEQISTSAVTDITLNAELDEELFTVGE